MSIIGLSVFLAGCGAPPTVAGPRIASEGTPGQAEGDWDDVEAAVGAAAGRSEVAVLRVTRPDADTVEFALRTIFDEEGILVLRRAHGSGDPAAMTVEARLGVGGDARREARLVRDVAHRLRQLRGVDYAPLDDGW